MLPDSYINYSKEVISFIVDRNSSFDTKTRMLLRYVKAAYCSIDRIDIAKKATGGFIFDKVVVLDEIKNSIIDCIKQQKLTKNEKNIWVDFATCEYDFSRYMYGRDAYIDSFVYMPDTDSLEQLFQERSIKKVAIYGVGSNAEVTAVIIYRKIKKLAEVILVDRDAGRFNIDATNPGRLCLTDSDYYELNIFLPTELSNKVDLVIVAAAGYITEIRDSLKSKTDALIVSPSELRTLIENS